VPETVIERPGREQWRKRKLTKAELGERDARHERMLANARRTRELAEKAPAKLEAERGRR
jgi:hypothetical protein